MVVPDVRRRAWTGAYSVERVSLTSQGSDRVLRLEPFHSFRHGEREDGGMFWSSRRQSAGWRTDHGTDLYLAFMDLSSRTVHPEADAVTVGLLCHNYDLPSRLPFGSPDGDLQMEGGGPLRGIAVLGKPTDPIHPPLGRPQLWRLISTLSLNYTSLVEGGADTLRELLRLEWRRIVSERSDLKLQFYYDHTYRRIPNTYTETRDTLDVEFQHSVPVSARHDLLWGAGIRFTSDEIDNSTFSSFEPPSRSDNTYSLFVQDKIGLAIDRVYLSLGSRLELSD
jgi:hypothetical protein